MLCYGRSLPIILKVLFASHPAAKISAPWALLSEKFE